MDIVEELRHDYCNCLDDYKIRGRTDPQCESCSTKEERHSAANEIESLRQQLADLTARLEASEELNKKLQSLVDANQKLMDVQGRRENRQARLEAQEASEPVACSRCGGSGIVPIGDGYSVDP